MYIFPNFFFIVSPLNKKKNNSKKIQTFDPIKYKKGGEKIEVEDK